VLNTLNAIHGVHWLQRKQTKTNRFLNCFLSGATFLLALQFAATAPAQTAGRKAMAGHVPAAVARLQSVGALPGTTNLQLAIGLPLRNTATLTNLLRELYDPASANYHHYLTRSSLPHALARRKRIIRL